MQSKLWVNVVAAVVMLCVVVAVCASARVRGSRSAPHPWRSGEDARGERDASAVLSDEQLQVMDAFVFAQRPTAAASMPESVRRCPPGAVLVEWMRNSRFRVQRCDVCGPNTMQVGAKCVPCLFGYGAVPGSTECRQCPFGVVLRPDGSCMPCPVYFLSEHGEQSLFDGKPSLPTYPDAPIGATGCVTSEKCPDGMVVTERRVADRPSAYACAMKSGASNMIGPLEEGVLG